jgi:putative ABC transport system ATP-binding protein
MNPGKKRQPIIHLHNVHKIYKMDSVKVQALKDINIDIYKGEFVSIQGPSGSGKSTLMHLIGALDLPTMGHILLDGKDISKMSESDLATIRGKKIGFIFQAFNLIPTLTALENVTFPMIFQTNDSVDKIERAKKLLAEVQMSHRINHRPTQISGGETQRIAIARSLANDPDIILADEPTGNLDSKTGHIIMKMFVELHQKFGKTIIIVTYDPYIANYAKRRINIVDGQIAHDHQAIKRFLWKGYNKK